MPTLKNRHHHPPRPASIPSRRWGLPVLLLLPSIFLGCGDGIPDYTAEELAEVLRLANRVPLLYQASACAMSKAALSVGFRFTRFHALVAIPVGLALITFPS